MTSWDDLRVFLAVARAGSATAAARRLGLSQPTVSRRVAALARELGVELLRPDARGYELTPVGRRLRTHLEGVERRVLTALRGVDRAGERSRGTVRLTAPEGLGLAIIAPRLWEFERDHPGIELVLVAEAAVANLSRREADLALRFVRPRQRDLVMQRVASVPFAPYASARYLRERPRPPGAGIVAGDVLVAPHESQEGSPEAGWLQAHAGGLRVRVRVLTPLAVRSALLADAGVGLLPDYLGDEPGLRRLGPAALHRDLFLVHHRALRGVERVRLVARFVASCLARSFSRPVAPVRG
jgi:DNA-binding transcriptional LysR family regulator